MEHKLNLYSSILPLYFAFLLSLVLTNSSWGQEGELHTVQWEHGVLVHLDSVGKDYRFTGHAVDAEGLPVYHRAVYPFRGGGAPRLADVQYQAVDFPIVDRPSWLSEELPSFARAQRGRNETSVRVQLPAFRVGKGGIERLVSYRIHNQPTRGTTPAAIKQFIGKKESVLARGQWVQIGITGSGVYKLTYSELKKLGFDQPEYLSVWGNDGHQLSYLNTPNSPDDLQQIAVQWVLPNGRYDHDAYALFYLGGATWWSYDSKENIYRYHWHDFQSEARYFITTSQPEKKVEKALQLSATHVQDGYWVLDAYRKPDILLASTGRDYFSLPFNIRHGQEFTLSLDEPTPANGAKVGLHLAAASLVPSSFSVGMDGTSVGVLPIPPLSAYAVSSVYANVVDAVFTVPSISSRPFTLTLQYSYPSPSSNAWVRWIEFNIWQRLAWKGSTLLFHSEPLGGVSQGNRLDIQGLPSDAQVWDVTDPYSAQELGAQKVVPASQRRVLVAFTPSSVKEVNIIGHVANQNIHGTTEIPNLAIVTHEMFRHQAERIAELYRHSALSHIKVQVVTAQQVYNEFSSGNRDVSAIRNYARMLYWRGGGGGGPFRHLLLIGKPLVTMSSEENLIPHFQAMNSYDRSQMIASDDYFGLLDEDEGEGMGAMDISVGRYAVASVEDMRTLVEHEYQYHNPSTWGDWLVRGLSVGDDGDGEEYMRTAEQLAAEVEALRPEMMIKRLLFEQYPKHFTAGGSTYPGVNRALSAEIERGISLLNYVGHASHVTWAEEAVLTPGAAFNWRNHSARPVLIAASCLFARYDFPEAHSLGEDLLLLPRGGVIAVVAANRVTYADPNREFNSLLLKHMYPRAGASASTTLGEAIRESKVSLPTASNANTRRYTLIGNPALPLPNPNAKAGVVEVKGKPPTGVKDVLQALEPVSFTAIFNKPDGTPLDGVAYFTVKGPEETLHTLPVESHPPVDYKARPATLFRGKAAIRNGRATARFIVPADIASKLGQGLVSMVGVSDEGLSVGGYTDFSVGGQFANPMRDTEGPQIALALDGMRDATEGWVVGTSTTLTVNLRDTSGINMSNAGLEPGIVAYLERNGQRTTYPLSEAYSADEDTYTRGSASYTFHGLEPGEYRLRVVARDTYNNASEQSLRFTVARDSEPVVSDLINYPNPFTTSTSFYFHWTRQGEPCDVVVQIYTPDGRLVRTLVRHFANPKFLVGPISWDGRDAHERRLGRGVYFYRVFARVLTRWWIPTDGQAEGFGKLLHL